MGGLFGTGQMSLATFYYVNRCTRTYHFDFAFAIVLESERERLFESCRGFVKCEECLVWLLARLALSGSEDDLETVGPGQADGRREGGGQREPLWLSATYRSIGACIQRLTSL
jgi:hypothetical protein